MKEKELILLFPVEKVSEVEYRGQLMMRVRTGMLPTEFIKMMMLYTTSDEETAAVVEKKKEVE